MSLPANHDRQEQRPLTAGERQFSTLYGVSLLLFAGLVVGSLPRAAPSPAPIK